MNLTETDARKIFKDIGIPVYDGYLVKSVDEAVNVASGLDGLLVLKAEVGVGSRGKAGGIKLCDVSTVESVSSELFSKKICGIPVEKIMIAKAVDIKREYYLSILLDTSTGEPVILASKEGGVDIEEVSEKNPDAILKTIVPIDSDMNDEKIKEIFEFLTLDERLYQSFSELIHSLISGFWKYNATLIEINPLSVNKKNELFAVDAKIRIDDYSLSKLDELGIDTSTNLTDIELEAKNAGLSYVQLDGDIGCVVNGAGLAMATVDAISEFGLKPANLLDVGGSSSTDKMVKAVNILLRNKGLKIIFINIFGGITRCVDIANGIIETLKRIDLKIPLVVHLSGNESIQAKQMLMNTRARSFSSMKSALEHVSEVYHEYYS